MLRSTGCEATPSVLRNESTGAIAGTAVPYSAATATVRRISSAESRGRTPSCTAISSTSGGSASSPRLTEWKRSAPPVATVCRATSKRAARSRQNALCSSGRTTTRGAPGSACAKQLIVRASTGWPSSSMNCLGRVEPMRRPQPPATMITPVRSISVFCRIRACCR